MTTQFHNLTIVHPHSGKVSRSVIQTLLIHEAKAFNTGFTDQRTRSERARDAAKYIASYNPGKTIHLKDVNNNIQIDRIY